MSKRVSHKTTVRDAGRLAYTMAEPIAIEGRNCWRYPHADRVAFLVDGEAYFTAFAQAVNRAERSVFILGWDIDSRVRLFADGRVPGLPSTLAPLLKKVISRRPELNVYVLPWDFATFYLLEREPLPMTMLNLGWSTQGRLHVHWDGNHPVGASHHQKIVVVDDRMAFVGGFDLTSHRWDTPEHRPEDPRRKTSLGVRYGPFHDVQVAVDGDAAAALGDLARRRWERATGERLAPPAAENDPWPADLAPDLRNVRVAIARTEPSKDRRLEVREAEALFVDSIAAARGAIYIECQYLTSRRIGDALAERLQEEACPEVVIVTTRECGGWLEELTMGVLRSRLLRRLKEADRFGRLRVYCAMADSRRDIHTEVHSKVMVIDETFLRIGSANLTNRSMAFDTECDLAFEALGEDRIRQGIRRFRDRLLAEHLGTSPDRVAAAVAARASLIGAVEALRGASPHTLMPLDAAVPSSHEELIPEDSIADPERPLESARLLEYFLHDEPDGQPVSRQRLLVAGAAVAGLVLLAMLWTFSPLRAWATPQRLLEWADPIRHSPMAPLIVIGVYVVGALVVFPRVLLTVQTALIFGPLLGGAYALLGSLTGALVTYWLGRALGRHTVRRLTGRRINRLTLRLARSGTLAVAAVRAVPLAPATVVSLVCGAAGVRFRHFFLGTLLGSLPGLLALIAFGDQLGRTIRSPGPGDVALLAAMGLAIVGVAVWLRRGFRNGRRPAVEREPGSRHA